MKPHSWPRPGNLLRLLLLPPALLAAACMTEARPASPTPEQGFTTEADKVHPTLKPEPNPDASAPESASAFRSSLTLQLEDEPPEMVAGGALPISIRNITSELVEQRPEYDIATDIATLIKPHFLARTAEEDLIEISAPPNLIVEWEGKAVLRAMEDGVASYIDLLALQSELLGEHPVHKIYRLMAMGIPLSDDLRNKLTSDAAADLFTNVEFEYLRGKEGTGVVSEVFPDGTLLVIPLDLPREWRSQDSRIASPSHLHLNPRALNAGVSDLAREYEREILALPFDEQRYPAAALARKQCDLYRESLNHSRYANLMNSLGFRFTPQHVAGDLERTDLTFGRRMQSLLWGGAGVGMQYYGFEGEWISDILRQEEVTWLEECDTAGGIRNYQGPGDTGERYYLTVRRSLEPDKRRRYRILALDDTGRAEEIYTAPGIILMALPMPFDDRTWLLSAEGWPSPEGDKPADPRWQAVYMVNLASPEQYEKVRYPIAQFPDAPEAGLYGVSPRLSGDGGYLFNTLYGFRDEGGGIWVVDVSQKGFQEDRDKFARIVDWDHTLSWTLLNGPAVEPPVLHVFMTGKEVADDFAMTANILRIRDAGLESSVEREERLLQMAGWNPTPLGWQRLSDSQYRVLVETHYNYESSLLPRAKGVYIVPVNLSIENGGN